MHSTVCSLHRFVTTLSVNPFVTLVYRLEGRHHCSTRWLGHHGCMVVTLYESFRLQIIYWSCDVPSSKQTWLAGTSPIKFDDFPFKPAICRRCSNPAMFDYWKVRWFLMFPPNFTEETLANAGCFLIWSLFLCCSAHLESLRVSQQQKQVQHNSFRSWYRNSTIAVPRSANVRQFPSSQTPWRHVTMHHWI